MGGQRLQTTTTYALVLRQECALRTILQWAHKRMLASIEGSVWRSSFYLPGPAIVCFAGRQQCRCMASSTGARGRAQAAAAPDCRESEAKVPGTARQQPCAAARDAGSGPLTPQRPLHGAETLHCHKVTAPCIDSATVTMAQPCLTPAHRCVASFLQVCDCLNHNAYQQQVIPLPERPVAVLRYAFRLEVLLCSWANVVQPIFSSARPQPSAAKSSKKKAKYNPDAAVPSNAAVDNPDELEKEAEVIIDHEEVGTQLFWGFSIHLDIHSADICRGRTNTA